VNSIIFTEEFLTVCAENHIELQSAVHGMWLLFLLAAIMSSAE